MRFWLPMRSTTGKYCMVLVLAAGPLWGQGELVIVNGASFSPAPTLPYVRGPGVPGIVPGSLITLFGIDLTSAKGVVAADRFPLPTELGGTSVNFDGVPAPLLAVATVNGREQINLQVPYGLSVGTPDPACVLTRAAEEVCAGERALWVNAKGVEARYVGIVAYLEAQPGIFTVDGRAAVALHTDTGRLVSAADPAKPGEVVAIYATGLGPLKGVVASGVPAPASPPIETLNRPTATVGGLSAEVLFSGLAPGLVGVNQVNVRVPVDAPSADAAGGQLDLSLRLSNSLSNTVKLAVSGKPQMFTVSAEPNRDVPLCHVLYYCDYIVTLQGKGFSRNATIEVVGVNSGNIFARYTDLKIATSDTIQFFLSGASPNVIYTNGGFLITVVNPGGVRSNAIQQWSSTDHPDS